MAGNVINVRIKVVLLITNFKYDVIIRSDNQKDNRMLFHEDVIGDIFRNTFTLKYYTRYDITLK